jgi:hypothetical protein
MVVLTAAKLDLLGEDRRESPLFLMDDFDSDLDEVRVDSLIEFLRGGGFQALLTTSKDWVVARLGDGNLPDPHGGRNGPGALKPAVRRTTGPRRGPKGTAMGPAAEG